MGVESEHSMSERAVVPTFSGMGGREGYLELHVPSALQLNCLSLYSQLLCVLVCLRMPVEEVVW